MFRVLRKANEYTLELTIAGRTLRKDLSGLKPHTRAKLVTRLFKWHRAGAVGFPNLEV